MNLRWEYWNSESLLTEMSGKSCLYWPFPIPFLPLPWRTTPTLPLVATTTKTTLLRVPVPLYCQFHWPIFISFLSLHLKHLTTVASFMLFSHVAPKSQALLFFLPSCWLFRLHVPCLFLFFFLTPHCMPQCLVLGHLLFHIHIIPLATPSNTTRMLSIPRQISLSQPCLAFPAAWLPKGHLIDNRHQN